MHKNLWLSSAFCAFIKSLNEFKVTQVKLEKRTQKLKTLESEIAEMERRAYLPRAAESGQAPEEDQNLRPARLIYNPKSGAHAKDTHSLEEIVGTLRAHGIRPEVAIKTSGKVARAIAREAADKNEALVIVAGGDGNHRRGCRAVDRLQDHARHPTGRDKEQSGAVAGHSFDPQ
jgi:nucleotide-binding universal stress UspA family protein